ncbi:hypothetical protein K501DRAFT_42930 [Backusella circina FSU 941]|nr:hypothetical protein K501DRAFT_42930 [Backusella circina FSU 941]
MKSESGSLHDADHSPTDIPLIILTEPSQPHETTRHQNSSSSPSRNTSLPLTKDILRRKNKLDRLLNQNDRFNHLPLEYSTSSAVDERVTAGLGISTMNDTSSGLRSRRRSSARPTSLAIPSPSYNNTSYSSPIQSESQWSFDLGTYGTTKSGSSRENPKTASSTRSGSSVRNSASMQPYSVYHQHPHHRHHARREEYQRINQDTDKSDIKSENYILNILFSTASRVVSARAPESKQVANTENFDFYPLEHDIPPEQPPVQKASMEKDEATIQKSSLSEHSKRQSWLSISVGRRSSTTSERDESFSIIDRRFSTKPSSSLNIELLFVNNTMPNPLQGYSLGFFGPNSRCRIFAWRFIRKRWVESFMLFLMILHFG